MASSSAVRLNVGVVVEAEESVLLLREDQGLMRA